MNRLPMLETAASASAHSSQIPARRRRNRAWALMICTLFVVGASTALVAGPPEGKGKPAKHHPHKHKGGNHQQTDSGGNSVMIRAGITLESARSLAVNHRATGYGNLPPGIRKNLARGKPLPPGLAKRSVPTPVLNGLPRHPGYEWQIVGSDLVLVAVATAVIADVFFGVFD